ncbi:MAG: hypothetical protein L0Z55_11590 [Planctomycetes bacterium]|nr:hypothetical protein [Planctomycetota bacterium]
MPRLRRAATYGIVLVCLIAAAGGAEPPAAKAVEALVRKFVAATGAERRALLPELRGLGAIPKAEIRKWIQLVRAELAKRPRSEAKDGVAKLHHADYPIRYRVVKKRDGKDLSLLVLLHSGGGSAETNDATWKLLDNYRGVPFDIIAMPRVWDDSHGAGWVMESGPLAVDGMIRELLRTYPIDTNNIHLNGYSMGGYGTSYIGCLEADRFASLGVIAAGYANGGERVANLLHVPLTVHIGEKDTDSDHIGTARDLKRRVEACRSQAEGGYELLYKEYPGTGHQLGQEATFAACKWSLSHRRDPHPRRVIWEPFDDARFPTHKHYFYWLGMDSPRTGMRIEATIHDNVVEVAAARVKRFTIFLNSKLLDVEKEVVVTVNGEAAFRGILEPSFSAIVESFAAKEDPQLIYTHRIEIGE